MVNVMVGDSSPTPEVLKSFGCGPDRLKSALLTPVILVDIIREIKNAEYRLDISMTS